MRANRRRLGASSHETLAAARLFSIQKLPSSSLDSDVKQTTAIDRPAVVEWIHQVRDSAKGTQWGSALDFEGVNAIDVMLVPIYLALLHALRRTRVDRKRSAQRTAAGQGIKSSPHYEKESLVGTRRHLGGPTSCCGRAIA